MAGRHDVGDRLERYHHVVAPARLEQLCVVVSGAVAEVQHSAGDQRGGAVAVYVTQAHHDECDRSIRRQVDVHRGLTQDVEVAGERLGIEAQRPRVLGALIGGQIGGQIGGHAIGQPRAGVGAERERRGVAQPLPVARLEGQTEGREVPPLGTDAWRGPGLLGCPASRPNVIAAARRCARLAVEAEQRAVHGTVALALARGRDRPRHRRLFRAPPQRRVPWRF